MSTIFYINLVDTLEKSRENISDTRAESHLNYIRINSKETEENEYK